MRASLKDKFTGSSSWLAVVGAMFFWTWQDQCMFGPTLGVFRDVFAIGDLQSLLMLGSIVGLILYAVANWSKETNVWVPRSCIAVAFCGALGCLLCGLALVFNAPAFVIVGCTLMGLSIGMLLPIWGIVAITQGMEKAILHFSAAWALGLVTTPLFICAPAAARWWLAAALPLLSMICYLLLFDRQGDPRYSVESTHSNVEAMDDGYHILGLSLPFALTIFALCLSYGLAQSFGFFVIDIQGIVVSPVDTLLVRFLTAALVLCVCLFRSLERLGALFEIGLSFLIIGSVAILASLNNDDSSLIEFGRVLTAAGYAFFDVLVWSLIAYYGKLEHARAQRAVVGGMLFEQVGLFCGGLLYQAFLLVPSEIDFPVSVYIFIACVYLLVMCSFFVVRRYTELWPMFDAVPALEESRIPNVEALRENAVAAIAEEHNLTSRETEVLTMLSSGRDVPRIAEQLCISENTVKTHVRHIYEKCEFHNRQDLLDSVERRINV